MKQLDRVKFVTISGRTGVGKSTLFEALLNQYPDVFQPVLSYTTRARRVGDESAYRYCTEEVFRALEEKGEFAWTATVLGNHFGTLITDLVTTQEAAKTSLMVLTPETIRVLRYTIDPSRCCHFYLLAPPDEIVLEHRLRVRGGMSQEMIRQRLAEDRTWDGEAERSGLPFQFIPSTLSKEGVFERVVEFLKGTET